MALRSLAPAGAPIALVDLVRAATLMASGKDVSARLREEFTGRLGVRYCFLTCTGRAGLTILLRGLARLAPERRDVIVPSYTCYSVAASVIKAGLRPQAVDICPETLDYDQDELRSADLGRALAVVATNLYGLPSDSGRLGRIAGGHGAFLVDDAAQALGATISGRPCGTWGDAGLFSLDKGKNVSAIDGGVLVAHEDRVGRAIEREWSTLAASTASGAIEGCLKAIAYSVMLRPFLYGIPARIPQLGLGQTIFTTDFTLQLPSRPLVALAEVMLRKQETFTRARVANATALLDGLRDASGIRTIAPHPEAAPVYLRLPILARNEYTRHQTIQALRAAGIGATGSYPAALADVPALKRYLAVPGRRASGGREVARRMVTLPTHPFVSPGDVERMIDVVMRVADGMPAAAGAVLRG